MSEFPSYNPENEIWAGVFNILAEYLGDEDREFVDEVGDIDGTLNYVYGRLMEIGEDPNEILRKFGILEEDGDEV